MEHPPAGLLEEHPRSTAANWSSAVLRHIDHPHYFPYRSQLHLPGHLQGMPTTEALRSRYSVFLREDFIHGGADVVFDLFQEEGVAAVLRHPFLSYFHHDSHSHHVA